MTDLIHLFYFSTWIRIQMELDVYPGPVAGSKIFPDPEFFFEKSANFADFSLLSFFSKCF